MLRHGDVGVPGWQPIPYGARVEAEASVGGGYTIPTRMRGGWWYGTERYTPDDASVFRVRGARFMQDAIPRGRIRDPQPLDVR